FTSMVFSRTNRAFPLRPAAIQDWSLAAGSDMTGKGLQDSLRGASTRYEFMLVHLATTKCGCSCERGSDSPWGRSPLILDLQAEVPELNLDGRTSQSDMPRAVQSVFLIQGPGQSLSPVNCYLEFLRRIIPLNLDQRPGCAPSLAIR